MSRINSARALEDPDYAELYLKYLGTLKVLGKLASRTDAAEHCMNEEIVACTEDAREFLAPHITISTHEHGGFTMDVAR